jgi:hypothetical protein
MLWEWIVKMSVDLIQIKEQTYYKEYKDIVKKCYNDGVILPFLLDVIEVPEKYQFTDKELSKLKISDEARALREIMRMDKQEKLADIHFTGDLDEVNDQLNIVDNEELMNFIARYPEYKKLLK